MNRKLLLSAEDEIVLLSFVLHPDEKQLDRLNHCMGIVQDWPVFASSLADRGIGQLLFRKLPMLSATACISQEARSVLKQSYLLTLSRNMRMQQAFSEIAALCKDAGCVLIPLKGILLLETLYHDIGLRLLSDIDLLTIKEDAAVVLRHLHDAGYCSEETKGFVGQNREIVHFDPLIKNGISVELHVKLHRLIERYSIDEATFVFRSKSQLQVPYAIPDPIDHLIFIGVHLDRHFRQGAIQLSGYCDLLNLCSDLHTDLWQLLQKRCLEWNCEKEFFTHVMLLEYFDALRLPEFLRICYATLLTEAEILRFVDYLQGKRFFQSGVPNHLSSISQLSFIEKILYILGVFFPSKSFMFEKYGQKKVAVWWFWYPYRWWTGVTGWWGSLRSRS